MSRFCSECGRPLEEGERCPQCHPAPPQEDVSASAETMQPPAPTSVKPKGIKGFFWCFQKGNYAILSAKEKRGFVLSAVLGGICLWVVAFLMLGMVITLLEGPSIAAEPFVEAWNEAAATISENITRGVSIDCKQGQNEYDLGNGVVLNYRIAARSELTRVTYRDPDFMAHDPESVIREFVGMITEIEDKETVIKNLLSDIAALVPSGVQGVDMSWSDLKDAVEVGAVYVYSEGCAKGAVTGLTSGISLSEAFERYNKNYIEERENKYDLNAADSEYINCAKTLISQTLLSPATASYSEGVVEAKDEYGRAIVSVCVDSQNGFGAFVRTNFCIAISGIYPSDNTFDYLPNAYMETYSDSNAFLKDAVIESLKSRNNWGKPADADEGLSEEDFAKTDKDGYTVYEKETGSIFVDGETGKVFSTKARSLTDTLQSLNEDELFTIKQKVLINFLQITNGSTYSYTSGCVEECYDFETFSVIGSKYERGYLYEAYVEGGYTYFCVTAVAEDVYGAVKETYSGTGGILTAIEAMTVSLETETAPTSTAQTTAATDATTQSEAITEASAVTAPDAATTSDATTLTDTTTEPDGITTARPVVTTTPQIDGVEVFYTDDDATDVDDEEIIIGLKDYYFSDTDIWVKAYVPEAARFGISEHELQGVYVRDEDGDFRTCEGERHTMQGADGTETYWVVYDVSNLEDGQMVYIVKAETE